MQRRALRSLPLAVLIVSACLPQTRRLLPLPPRTVTLHLPVRRVEFDNGARVFLLPDETSDIIQVAVRYEVGSSADPPGKAGLAHLVEHLTFVKRPGGEGTAELAELLAAETFEYNASTTWDTTHYRATARSDRLQRLVELELDRMGAPCASIDPSGFKRKHYSARNATLILVGNFDAEIAEAHIRASFGEWSSGGRTEAVAAATGTAGPVHRGIPADDSPVVHARLTFGDVPRRDGEPLVRRMAIRLVLSAMLEGRAGTVRNDLGASYGASVRYTPYDAGGVFAVEADLDAERADEGVVALRFAIDSLRTRDRAFDEDFVQARRAVVEGLMVEAQSSGALAARLQFIEAHGLSLGAFDDLVGAVAEATPDEVAAAAAAIFDPDREVVVCVGPKAAVKRAFRAIGVDAVSWAE